MRIDGESLPVQGILLEIIKRESTVYDVVYFYGKSNATLPVVDELLRNYLSHHKHKNAIRINGQAFIEDQLQKIRNGKFLAGLSEEELHTCDLFVFEEIDRIAGRQMTEQSLYGLLDWLLEHNVQIVITGSTPIAHMDKLAPRIHAQLDGGISCQVM